MNRPSVLPSFLPCFNGPFSLYPVNFTAQTTPASESAKQRMSFVKLSIFGTSFEVRSFSYLKSVRRGLIGCRVCGIGWEGHDSICRPSTGRNGYVFSLAQSRSPPRSSLGELKDWTLTFSTYRSLWSRMVRLHFVVARIPMYYRSLNVVPPSIFSFIDPTSIFILLAP